MTSSNKPFTMKASFQRNAPEIQFWGYEGGNILASIAGAGGVVKFGEDVSSVFGSETLSLGGKILEMTAQYPDASVAIGLGGLVVLAPVVRNAAQKISGTEGSNVTDAATAGAAVVILGYAASQDASLITTAASAFVVGSSFLRQCSNNPFMLKIGGLALATGGALLGAFGVQSAVDHLANPDTANAFVITVDALTTLTGLYVANASLLTYEGGIYETKDFDGSNEPEGWVDGLVHPTQGTLAIAFEKTLDQPIQWVNANIGKPAIFWVGEGVKSSEPFTTSMWARLPWRGATGGLSLVMGVGGLMGANVPAGQFEFALANAGWAVGDTAIGSLDWKDNKPSEDAPSLDS